MQIQNFRAAVCKTNFKLQSTTFIVAALQQLQSALNYISRSTISNSDLVCIFFDEKWTVILKVFLYSDSLLAIFPSF